jgi:DNA-binding transcriptional LysR family regulator
MVGTRDGVKHQVRVDLQGGVVDLSTRRLRYFVAVAEELHFSRAAARLFVSQQGLSRQIRDLEDDLGVPLFERSTRKVELTPAGAAFLPACRDILDRLDEATRVARNTGQGLDGTLNLGFFVLAALELTTPILTEFSNRYPQVQVVMQEFAYRDPSAGLAEGSSDLAIVRLPIALPDLRSAPLFTEPRVVAVATSHRLAARERISVRDLDGERLTRAANSDPEFRRFWSLADYLPDSVASAVETTSHAEELEVVATGQACSITAACAARYAPHAGVRYLCIDDVPGVTTALAWRAGGSYPQPSPRADRFVELALQVRDRETDLVAAIEHPDVSPASPRAM